MIEPCPSIETHRVESVVRGIWKHLRIPYQLTLAPIFLWGYFLSAPVSWRILPAFVVMHFLLYPGITAYNSYYDRDEGPIGGMRNPPQVDRPLFGVAIILKVAGFLMAIPLGFSFAVIYAVFVVLSVLYSQPRFRWKANPWLSAGVVGAGQGGLGFLAGWMSAGESLVTEYTAVLGFVSACLTTLGMYPLTQLFQMEEDSARGDRTLCVALGRSGALRLSQATLVCGGSAALLVFLSRNPIVDAVVLGVGYLILIGVVEWLRRYSGLMSRYQTFRLVTAISYGSSAGFAILLLTRVARWE